HATPTPDVSTLSLHDALPIFDGAGGAGLVPLAFITGYGSDVSWGANAHYTDVKAGDFQLAAYGVAAGAWDRVELSYTHHNLDVGDRKSTRLNSSHVAISYAVF